MSSSFLSLQFLSVVVINFGGIFVGLTVSYYSCASAEITSKFGVKALESQLINALFSITAIPGAMFASFLLSRMGRRPVLYISSVIGFVSYAIIGVFDPYAFVWISRALAGIAVGMYSSLCQMYTDEICPKEISGTCGYAYQFMLSTGLILANLIGSSMNYQKAGLVCSLFPLVQGLTIYLFIPESEAYLKPKNSELESSTVKESVWNYPKEMFVAIAAVSFQQLSGVNALFANLARIFEDVHSPLSLMAAGCLVSFSSLLATIIVSFTSKCLDYRRSWDLSSGGQMLAFLLLWANELWKWSPYISVVGLFLDLFFFGLGFGPVAFYVASMVLPQNIRASGMSVASSFCWASSAVSIFIWEPMSKGIGTGWGFFVFGMVALLGLLFGLFAMPVFDDSDNEEREARRRLSEQFDAYNAGDSVERRLSNLDDVPTKSHRSSHVAIQSGDL